MHDGMAQVLASVNTKAQAVREYLRRGRQEDAEKQLDELARAARDIYTDVREGILSLRTSAQAERSVHSALEEFLRMWKEQTGISVQAAIADDIELSSSVELQLLRIVQEALANVRKHSGASQARLEAET